MTQFHEAPLPSRPESFVDTGRIHRVASSPLSTTTTTRAHGRLRRSSELQRLTHLALTPISPAPKETQQQKEVGGGTGEKQMRKPKQKHPLYSLFGIFKRRLSLRFLLMVTRACAAERQTIVVVVLVAVVAELASKVVQ